MRQKQKTTKKVCMMRTGISFEGYDLYLAVNDPYSGKGVKKRFRSFIGGLMSRPAIGLNALLHYSFGIREKLVDGSIWN